MWSLGLRVKVLLLNHLLTTFLLKKIVQLSNTVVVIDKDFNCPDPTIIPMPSKSFGRE